MTPPPPTADVQVMTGHTRPSTWGASQRGAARPLVTVIHRALVSGPMATGITEGVCAPRGAAGRVAVLGVLALSACATQGHMTTAARQASPATPPTPAPVAVAPRTAPTRPPAVHAELVPPPPGGGPVVWQPGHWDYTGDAGNRWAWHDGHYVPPPPGETTWVPGRWSHASNGSWVWIDGHWA